MPAVYRFRVTFEDYDDVYRDIEIKSSQTFEDLHNIIQKSVNFDGAQLASFYMSDDNWSKGREITLMNMADTDDKQEEEDDDDRPKNKKPKPLPMKEATLADFILDPHQKIYYVFDFMAMWTFFIELIKIIPGPDKNSYPRVIKSVNEAPKQYGSSTLGAVSEDFDFLDEVAVVTAPVDDEELPEGEEGEESTVDDLDLESPDYLKDQEDI
jgi:hypothetical protein